MHEVMMTWLDSHTHLMLVSCSKLQMPSVQALVASADWSSAKPACGLVFCVDKSSGSTCAHVFIALPGKQEPAATMGLQPSWRGGLGPLSHMLVGKVCHFIIGNQYLYGE